MNFSGAPAGLGSARVSSFEVCLQLLHLLTLAHYFLLDMFALGYDTIDLKNGNAGLRCKLYSSAYQH